MSSLHNKISVPAARSRIDTLKVRRRLILGALLLAAAAGIIATFAWLNSSSTPAASSDNASLQATSLARIVAIDYLSGKPTTVPTAKDVPANFGYASTSTDNALKGAREPVVSSVTRVTWPSNPPIPVDLVRFYVPVDRPAPVTTPLAPGEKAPPPIRQYYSLTVPMAVGANYPSPVLAAIPTLAPTVLTGSGLTPELSMEALSSKIDPSTLNANVTTRVNDWAARFVEGQTVTGANDPAGPGKGDTALKQMTADTDPTHQYAAMGGWKFDSVKILGAAAPPLDAEGNPQAGTILRVSLTMTPPTEGSVPVTSTYDVWVLTDGYGDQPPIVAWAPSGAYSQMKPYMNARVG